MSFDALLIPKYHRTFYNELDVSEKGFMFILEQTLKSILVLSKSTKVDRLKIGAKAWLEQFLAGYASVCGEKTE